MTYIGRSILNYFSGGAKNASAIQYSSLDKFSLYGTPIAAYGFIGLTAFILAAATIYENNSDNETSSAAASSSPTPATGGSRKRHSKSRNNKTKRR